MSSVWSRGFKSNVPEPGDLPTYYCEKCNEEFTEDDPCECQPRDDYEALGIDTYHDLDAYRLWEDPE